MNPVAEWNWKGGVWLLGALLLLVLSFQLSERSVEANTVPLSVIGLILQVLGIIWITVELWQQKKHRMALGLVMMWVIVIGLHVRSLLVMSRS